MRCAACEAPLDAPIFESPGEFSITSLCERVAGPTRVYFCSVCTHVQTAEMADLEAYYDEAYRILIDSEDEDQLYATAGERKIYRVEHQVATLLTHATLPPGSRVLDYGCAKSATMKALLAERPDLAVHLFDVSEMYLPFWRRFMPEERWATYRPRPEWAGSFDLVTSFFALEHVAAPRTMLRDVAALLRPGGEVYVIVPNVARNTADFIVLDHVNHFSAASLRLVLEQAGFEDVRVDGAAHQGAWLATGRKGTRVAVGLEVDVAAARLEVTATASYWRTLANRIRAYEASQPEAPVAIYGSGFYGTYIASCLAQPTRVAVFLDRNPHRQGKQLLGRPIVAPEQLPEDVEAVYVGLNPATARAAIAEVPALRARATSCFYL